MTAARFMSPEPAAEYAGISREQLYARVPMVAWSLREHAFARSDLNKIRDTDISLRNDNRLPLPRGMVFGRVYFCEAVIGDARRIKIGYTTYLDRRLRSLRAGSPVPIEMIGYADGDPLTEAWLHGRFHESRAHNEWFHATSALLELIERVSE